MAEFPVNEIMSLIGKAPRHDLGGSYGPNLHVHEVLGAQAPMGDLPFSYRTAAGDPRLREVIAGIYGVTAEDVIITVGGMHALFLLAFILCNRGDEAVTTSAIFPPARSVLDAVGATVRALHVSFEDRYRVDPEQLGRLLSPATTLVSLASPQNPSGVAIPHKTLQQLLQALRARSPRAFLLVDDTYREAAIGADPVAPSALSLGDGVVCVASLSKCYGAPGLRLGWVVTRDRELRDRLLRAKFNTVLSCPALDEEIGVRVFEQRHEIIAQRRDFLARCLDVMQSWVRANEALVDWVRPDAGAICCVRLKSSAFDDAAVGAFYRALDTFGVRVSNGAWFGDEARVFRVGFAHMPIADLERSLAALGDALRKAAAR
jgi:aspartate/methionine/tyrosine aminotransferase